MAYLILISASIESLIADLAAFYEISYKSAPENPSVIEAKKFKSISSAILVFLKFA